jgi:hypothetical protein
MTNNAFSALRETFESLLKSKQVPIDVTRSILRVQELRIDDIKSVAWVEQVLEGKKDEIATAVGKNLVEPDLALFAEQWLVSTLLASLLPRRDWNACFLDKLEKALEKIDVPDGCKVLKITGVLPHELKESKKAVMLRLDHMQRVFSQHKGDYPLVSQAKKRTSSSTTPNSKKATTNN